MSDVFDPLESERTYGLAPGALPVPGFAAEPAAAELPVQWAGARVVEGVLPWALDDATRTASAAPADAAPAAFEPAAPSFAALATPYAPAFGTTPSAAPLDTGRAPTAATAPTAPTATPVGSLDELLSAPDGDAVPDTATTDPSARFPRVNLLPGEVRGSRQLQRTQQLLAAGLAALLLVAGGAWWHLHSQTQAAAGDLAAEQARTIALQAQQARYAAVPAIEAKLTRLAAGRKAAMAGDVRWYELLDDIDRSAPDGVWLKSLTVTEAASAVSNGSTTAATDPLAQPTVATISFSGYGLASTSTAAWLDSLARVPGLADPRYTTSAQVELDGTTVTSFSSTVGVTAAALSGLYETAED